ncbi:type II CAAX endopeptidase family protein [Primorskyibacter aestuariivivens]|uniref:CPBP family intramembrane glutamic endopeptidase n=1 Tax=Primorskyibacter aestuariivivens TaxID=1888912 RepID=UPI0023003E8A|nr:type II CAAX endopeptidase family protein [Primorskyibacter aestuariivivens]MDA7427798.1 type II CAAX endopeptidase family protein [Primorskyibacter aestuariivivens]
MARFSSPYQAQSRFSDAAKDAPELWRTALGTLGGCAIYLALVWSATAVLLPLFQDTRGGPAIIITQLLLVALMGVAAAIIVQSWHKRPARSLFGDPLQARRDFLKVLPLQLIAISAVGLTMAYAAPHVLVSNRPFGQWLMILPFAVPAIILQCTAEEMVFRGYLQQQLSARYRHPSIWLGLPSALFALAHYSPALYDGKAWPVVFWAGVFGLAMADLTARSGTLGAAIAVHISVNISAILLVSLPGDMGALALYVLPFGAEDAEAFRALLPAEFVALVISWLAARLALRL